MNTQISRDYDGLCDYECGCAITAQTKKKTFKNGTIKIHTHYNCTVKREGCSQKSIYIRDSELHNQLHQLLNSYELSPKMHRWAMDAFQGFIANESSQYESVQEMQNKSIKETQQQLNRLLDLATKGLIDDDDYTSKSTALKASLVQLQAQQSDTSHRVRNWYEIATHTLGKLVNATDKFDAGDFAVKKEILMSIGQNPVLLNGKLTIIPYEWLLPISNTALTVRHRLNKVRTQPQKIQKASEEAVMSIWRRR